MKSNTYDAVVAGHVCLDITPSLVCSSSDNIAEIFVPGKLLHIKSTHFSTGGAVSNTGLPLIKLGIKTALMGKIGDDSFGAGIKNIFASYKAEKALTIVKGEQSSYTVVIAPPGIDRILLHHPGANDTFGSNDINYDLVSKTRLFHLGYPPLMRRLFENNGEETVKILKKIKKCSVTTSLDMALPDPESPAGKADWNSFLKKVLPYLDITPFSAEEAMFMLNRRKFNEIKKQCEGRDPIEFYEIDDFIDIATTLLRYGAKIAVLKCGAKGILLATSNIRAIRNMGKASPANSEAWADKILWHNVFEVKKIVSATGAGDNAIAGFLSAFLRGSSPEEALAAACCAGAQNLLVVDAVSGIKSWEHTIQLSKRWKVKDYKPGKNWRYNAPWRIWEKT